MYISNHLIIAYSGPGLTKEEIDALYDAIEHLTPEGLEALGKALKEIGKDAARMKIK